MNWVFIGPDNGLVPVWHQAITWTNAALLSIGLMGTYFSEIWLGILSLALKNAIEFVVCQNGDHFVQGVMSSGFHMFMEKMPMGLAWLLFGHSGLHL